LPETEFGEVRKMKENIRTREMRIINQTWGCNLKDGDIQKTRGLGLWLMEHLLNRSFQDQQIHLSEVYEMVTPIENSMPPVTYTNFHRITGLGKLISLWDLECPRVHGDSPPKRSPSQ